MRNRSLSAAGRLVAIAGMALAALAGSMTAEARSKPQDGAGILLEKLTWAEAEKALTPETVVVIPLGGAAKEHGYHLPLATDFIMAEYFKRALLTRANVVIAPAVAYHFYPAFAEYPGSTSLTLDTSRDLIVEICRSLARYGPRRFYVVNIGISTNAALKPAVERLAAEGILLAYTDYEKALAPTIRKIARQEGGTHADEVETSLMLFIDPASVDMRKAVKDYRERKGPPTRDPNNTTGTYLPSGVYGDATLATRDKGRQFTEALMAAILSDIRVLLETVPPPRP